MPFETKRQMQAKNAQTKVVIPSFDDLPDSALIRQSQLVQSSRRPGTPAPLPFSPSTLWRKVRMGQFPQPVRLSAGMTAWRVSDIRAWMEEAAAKEIPARPVCVASA